MSRKKTIAFSIIFILSLACIFADYVSPTQFQFRLYRYVAEDTLDYYFQDLDGNSLSEYDIDSTLDINSAQFKIAATTNWVSPYYVKLAFSALQLADGSDPDFYGWYNIRIFTDASDASSSVVKDLSFTSGSKGSAQTTFYGGNSTDVDESVDLTYYVALDFTTYLTSYDSGTYAGTITMEIVPE